MSEFPIGCQTITWGEKQREMSPQVFDEAKKAGYSGVELGVRHVSDITPDTLTQMLDEAGLALVALHVGGNLFNADQAHGERSALDVAIDYTKMAGAKIMMYSGMNAKEKPQLETELDMLSRAADACKAQDIHLLYHNHYWEFANDAWILNALIGDTSKALGFCPDIGWVMRGGMDTVEYLDKIKGRVGAMHFKDFGKINGKWETVMLGEGVAPLKDAATWIKKNTSGIWAIAEQDRAAVPPAEAVAQNAEFMRSLFE
jgi:sugar phosphate isomerase/epimerase